MVDGDVQTGVSLGVEADHTALKRGVQGVTEKCDVRCHLPVLMFYMSNTVNTYRHTCISVHVEHGWAKCFFRDVSEF